MRFIISILLTLSLFVVSSVSASEAFTLTNIGALDTQGKKYNQWWYEPQNVLLKGTGSNEDNIPLVIDGKTQTIKVNSEGKWQYDLGVLAIADHSIMIGSEGNKYSFVLTIGSSPPADMSGTKGGLPAAGAVLPLIGVITLAGALIYVGLKKSEV